jgi:hypothetical protein
MPRSTDSEDIQYSDAETKRRADAALKKMLSTPPTPRTAKKKPSPAKRKAKKARS